MDGGCQDGVSCREGKCRLPDPTGDASLFLEVAVIRHLTMIKSFSCYVCLCKCKVSVVVQTCFLRIEMILLMQQTLSIINTFKWCFLLSVLYLTAFC